jgi:hypothetical protein
MMQRGEYCMMNRHLVGTSKSTTVVELLPVGGQVQGVVVDNTELVVLSYAEFRTPEFYTESNRIAVGGWGKLISVNDGT